MALKFGILVEAELRVVLLAFTLNAMLVSWYSIILFNRFQQKKWLC